MDLLAICATTFGGCLLGALLPVINTEVLLISMAAMAPAGGLVPIVVLGAIGQITGKCLLYLAGRGTLGRFRLREHPKLGSVLQRLGSSPRASGFALFASASVGLPPLYAVSVASGMIGIPLARFVTIGLIGRMLRFGMLVQVPLVFHRVVA
jgi:membrane protein YqaA with SNARE-associated domain